MNLVVLHGNLGADVEVRHTKAATPVTTLRVATTDGYKDSDGNWQDVTDWHSVVVWGQQATFLGEYARKGDSVVVEGVLKPRTYEDSDKNSRTVVEVKARRVTLISKGARSTGSDESEGTDDDELGF